MNWKRVGGPVACILSVMSPLRAQQASEQPPAAWVAAFRADPEGRPLTPARIFTDGCPSADNWRGQVLHAFLNAHFDSRGEQLLSYFLASGIKRCGTVEAVGWFTDRITAAARKGDEQRMSYFIGPLRDVESPELRSFYLQMLSDSTFGDAARSRAGFALQRALKSREELADLYFKMVEAEALPWGWGNAVAGVLVRANAQDFLMRLEEASRREPALLANRTLVGAVISGIEMGYINHTSDATKAMASLADAIAEDPTNAEGTRRSATSLAQALRQLGGGRSNGDGPMSGARSN